MKRIFIGIMIGVCCMCSLCWGQNYFGTDGEDAKEMALFVRKMFKQSVLKQLHDRHPRAAMTWDGQLLQMDRALSTWIVCCEAKERYGKRTYYYWEVKVTAINDNPELIVKYNIPLQYL